MIIFLYLGPETILPFASILAALAGAVLMIWHRLIAFVRVIFGRSGASIEGEISNIDGETRDE